MQGRILTSPSHAYAQNIVQTQMIVNQHRFVRPQQQQVQKSLNTTLVSKLFDTILCRI